MAVSARSAVPHLEKYHGTETFLTEALTIEAKSRVSEAMKADKPFFSGLIRRKRTRT